MTSQKENPTSAADQLRQLLKKPEIILMAACYDALSAKLVEAAGFAATFMSGFGVSATRLGKSWGALFKNFVRQDNGEIGLVTNR